jgi:hypothetical protein
MSIVAKNNEPDAPPVTAQQRALAEWEKQAEYADIVQGNTLIGGAENENTLEMLCGVPIRLTRMTFRRSDIVVKAGPLAGNVRDYITVEAVIHPLFISRGGFLRPTVVFNDGSTGIYRQCVDNLAKHDFIILDDNLPEKGEANTTRYDAAYSGGDKDGTTTATSFDVSIICPEGLRKGRANDTDSYTWYLA